MVAYVLAGNATLRDIGNASIWGVATARAGGDTVDTNGFNLTLDQDTRYGLSGTTTTSLGSLTINAAKGGNINIDATKVWLVPFNTGSGTITAGTSITLSPATGNVIGLYSSMTVAPVLTGVATGWLKLTNVSGTIPSSGTFTQAGYTFTISGAPIRGFIELVGDELSTIVANRLGTVNITGEWYEVGTTSGSSATTYQLPTNGAVQYYPAIWVETGVGTGIYEPYPCSGSLVAASSTPTDAVRGKVCWASTGGVLRFGSDGTNTVGYVPVSGCKIRMPNILTSNCTTAARATNALPNATLATRYDFTSTGGGVININKALLNWYPSFAQAYSVTMTDVGISTQLLMSEVAQPMTLTRVAVGQEAANAQFGLSMSLCFAGGTFDSCVFTAATLAASGRYTLSLTDVSGFTFNSCKDFARVIRGNATTGAATLTRVNNCTWNNQVIGLGQYLMTTCDSLIFNSTIYYDGVVATATTNPMSVWVVASNTANCTFNELTFGGLTNAQPYTAILSVNAAGCKNIKLRNIGTSPSAQLSLGSANQTGTVLALAAGAAANTVKMQRVFASATRTNLYSMDNSSKNVFIENCMGDYADVPVNNGLNVFAKGIGATPTFAAQTAVYGTHYSDIFTAATAGRIGIMMNEPTVDTVSHVTLTGGAAFTAAGGLYMPVIGQSATFEMPYYALGHTLFTNSAAIMAGGTATNYNYNFSVDKNDGNGWSTMTTANYTATTLATALNALGALDPAKGVKVRLKITTITTNTTAITSFYIITTSTAAAQANYYPLDTNIVTFNGIPTGTDIVILTAGTTTILAQADANPTTSYAFTYSGAQNIDIGFIKGGYVPRYIRNLPLGTTDSSIPVTLTADRNYEF